MAGHTVASRAMEMLIGFYKEREIILAKELINKHNYTWEQLAKLQGITKQAAQQYYGKQLRK